MVLLLVQVQSQSKSQYILQFSLFFSNEMSLFVDECRKVSFSVFFCNCRFLCRGFFVYSLQLHLMSHVLFKGFAGAEFYRFKAYGLGAYVLFLHGRTRTFQCSTEKSQFIQFYIVTFGEPVAQRIADSLHNSHDHGVWHVLFFH